MRTSLSIYGLSTWESAFQDIRGRNELPGFTLVPVIFHLSAAFSSNCGSNRLLFSLHLYGGSRVPPTGSRSVGKPEWCSKGMPTGKVSFSSTTQVIQHPRSESKGCCCLQPFKSCASELPFPHQKNGAVPGNFLPPGRFCVVTSGNVKIWKQNFKWIVALEDGLCFTDRVFLCMDDVRGYGQPNVPAFLCAVEVCFINYCSGTASLYSYTSFFNHYILGATAPEKWKTFSWHSTWSF